MEGLLSVLVRSRGIGELRSQLIIACCRVTPEVQLTETSVGLRVMGGGLGSRILPHELHPLLQFGGFLQVLVEMKGLHSVEPGPYQIVNHRH